MADGGKISAAVHRRAEPPAEYQYGIIVRNKPRLGLSFGSKSPQMLHFLEGVSILCRKRVPE
jgi:hypothetical protein